MKLSTTMAYALEALVQLASMPPDQPIPCRQIAARGHMPERFLLQILRNLVTKGLLQSTRGVDGGYRLQRPATSISLLEVFEAVDGPLVTEIPSNHLAPELAKRLKVELARCSDACREHLAQIKLNNLT